MDSVTLSQEQLINTVHLVATMAISDLAKMKKKSTTEMFLSFMESRTAQMLYDTDTKLWCDGPAEVEAEYLKEVEENGKFTIKQNIRNE